MQTLTDVLRGQHRRIEALASAVTAAVLERDAARAQAQLELFRVAALEHLLQEDLELYPRLLEAVGPRTPPGRIVTSYASNMKRVTESVQEFLARHEGRLTLATFEREWREVM
ncbi:MAG: hypothetical protein ACOZQL_15240, partial [Myxococcota bacterium]